MRGYLFFFPFLYFGVVCVDGYDYGCGYNCGCGEQGPQAGNAMLAQNSPGQKCRGSRNGRVHKQGGLEGHHHTTPDMGCDNQRCDGWMFNTSNRIPPIPNQQWCGVRNQLIQWHQLAPDQIPKATISQPASQPVRVRVGEIYVLLVKQISSACNRDNTGEDRTGWYSTAAGAVRDRSVSSTVATATAAALLPPRRWMIHRSTLSRRRGHT